MIISEKGDNNVYDENGKRARDWGYDGIAGMRNTFHTWEEIEEMMYKGIKLALPAIVIIILVGLVIGAWIGGGVVATMIYYGLKLISPSLFLVTICLICGIVALAIGSSWSTMATVGVALSPELLVRVTPVPATRLAT